MSQPSLHVARQLLDRQLVDARELPCGKVDDVEVEGGVGSPLRIAALLVGNGAASPRLPALFHWISQKLFGHRIVRVPWSKIDTIGDRIKMKLNAEELGLGEGKTKASKMMRRLTRT